MLGVVYLLLLLLISQTRSTPFSQLGPHHPRLKTINHAALSSSPQLEGSPDSGLSPELSLSPSISQFTPEASVKPMPPSNQAPIFPSEAPMTAMPSAETSSEPMPPSTTSTSQPPTISLPVQVPNGFPGAFPNLPDQQRTTCFPGDARVTRVDGTLIRMADIVVGDEIVSMGQESISRVFAFTHRAPFVRSKFVQLHTPSGTLTVSAEHFILLGIRHGDEMVESKLMAAGEVREGMELMRADGGNGTVNRVGHVIRDGLFNPHTECGTLVVDGFVVSAYTKAVAVMSAHALLLPIRAAFGWFGVSVSGLENLAELRRSLCLWWIASGRKGERVCGWKRGN